MFTVTKFGGSSLSDAKQFAKVKNPSKRVFNLQKFVYNQSGYP